MNNSPIIAALKVRGIEVPASPIDVSEIFREKGITNVYVIAMTGRCGSTWLASELNSLPNCGNPSEYFSEEMIPYVDPGKQFKDVADLFRSIIDKGRTGDTFGFKIDGTRLKHLSSLIDIQRSFGPSSAKWIDMRRLNIVKQAFSFARAKKSGVWHIYASAEKPNSNQENQVTVEEISDATIWHEINLLMKSEKALSDTYHQFMIKPFSIKYEEMVDSKQQILLQSLAHLFPHRELPAISEEENGKTRKLTTNKMDPVEISFVRRNCEKINMLKLSDPAP